jgi:two-component sensor histidine kinase
MPLHQAMREHKGGPGQLRLALQNKALPRSSPDGDADVTVDVKVDGGALAIAVFDSGPGLPDGIDLARTGTLGLQLVRSLSRQLRGTLTAVRSPRAGVTLTCPLP